MKNRPQSSLDHKTEIQRDGETPIENNRSYDRLIPNIYEKALFADDISVFFSDCLKTIGETLEVSRIFLYEYREDSLVLKSIHEWTGGRLPAGRDVLMSIPKSRVPWWMDTITGNEIIKYSDINEIPSAFERRVLRQIGIKSLIAVPLYLSKRFYGFIGIADNTRNRAWDDGITSIIMAAAQIMTGVLSRKRADEALAVEKERLSVTIKSLADGVIATDRQGSVTLMNRMAEKLTGWHFEEARQKPLSDIFYFIDEKTREWSQSRLDRDAGGETVESRTFNRILVSRDGKERLVSATISPMLDHDAKYIGTVIVFRDISGERTLQEELRKIQKLESLGNLASGLAHDYNNILTSVIGNISLAKMKGNSPEEIHEYLEEAEKGLARATGLTQRLVSFSRDDSLSNRRLVDLRQLIEDITAFSLHGSNCLVETRIEEALWKAAINEMQIGQAIHNIIANALQAMPDGGKITITASNVYIDSSQSLPLSNGRYVRIFISDTGPGIPREIRDRIFEPFFTTRDNAHGLGLPASYSIIKGHNGHIDFQTLENEGSTFTLFIPANEEFEQCEQSGAPEALENAPVFSNKAKILLFYDSESARLLTGNILKAMGYSVRHSLSFEESRSMMEEAMSIGSPFDLVVIDIHDCKNILESLEYIKRTDLSIKVLLIDENHSLSPEALKNEGNIIITPPRKIAHLSSIIKSILAD
jgi:PAS domain S-box-containing protein